VYAEHFAVDNGGEGQEVEDLTACFPDGGVAVFCLAFFVEAVDLGDLAGLVVAADEGDAVGESSNVSEDREGVWEKGIAYFAFRHIKRVNVSKLKYPRSTKSPRKIKFCWPFPTTVFRVESASDSDVLLLSCTLLLRPRCSSSSSPSSSSPSPPGGLVGPV